MPLHGSDNLVKEECVALYLRRAERVHPAIGIAGAGRVEICHGSDGQVRQRRMLRNVW
jgi:hypothetical protein